MPKVSKPATGTYLAADGRITPLALHIAMKPIRILQVNGKIDEQNFHKYIGTGANTSGIPLHAGSQIRNINDLVDTAKVFEGRYINTGIDSTSTRQQVGGNNTSAYTIFRDTATGYDGKALFALHSEICNVLYQEDHTVRDVEFKLSYTRDDIEATFRGLNDSRKTIENELQRRREIIERMKGLSRSYPSTGRQTDDYGYVSMINERLNLGYKYDFIYMSQSIELEIPYGYEYDKFEIFGELDWGWDNYEGEVATDYSKAVGVLYLEENKNRDDFVCFKLSILFDKDSQLSEDDYVLAAGKIQYRLKRYA